jgi:hypothetical protein
MRSPKPDCATHLVHSLPGWWLVETSYAKGQCPAKGWRVWRAGCHCLGLSNEQSALPNALASAHRQGARALFETCLLPTDSLFPFRHAPAAACPPKGYTSRVLNYTVHAVLGAVVRMGSRLPDCLTVLCCAVLAIVAPAIWVCFLSQRKNTVSPMALTLRHAPPSTGAACETIQRCCRRSLC